MRRGFARWGGGYLVLLALLLTPPPVLAQGNPGNAPAQVPKKCIREADPRLGFAPRAITRTPLNVRTAVPEYSFLKGQWVFGQIAEVIPAGTCLAILDRQDVGIIQIWYFVRYKEGKKGELKTGWVWGGTIGKDENVYIGGDRTVPPKGSTLPRDDSSGVWAFLIGTAYAASEGPPAEPGSEGAPSDTKKEYLVFNIPWLGPIVTYGQFSALLLFLAMVAGMVAKAVWDETERGRMRPTSVQIVRPLLISPIAFSAFWGTMYIQTGNIGLSLTMVLYAFQIGFMWQHVLEKRIETEKKGGKSADVTASAHGVPARS